MFRPYIKTTTSGRIERFSETLYRRVLRTVELLTMELQGRVKLSKLSGQVLRTRTGTLRRSINRKVEALADRIKGTVGTNVHYARPHELGFSGIVSVREHLRQVKQAWGRPIDPRAVLVKAHSRTVNMPERSFLRSALREMAPTIRRRLGDAINSASR